MGGSGGAGQNILFIGETRVPQVDVHVHQSGADHQSAGGDDQVGVRLQPPVQQGDLAVLDEQVLQQDRSRDRVDHPAMLDQYFHGFRSSEMCQKVKKRECSCLFALSSVWNAGTDRKMPGNTHTITR